MVAQSVKCLLLKYKSLNLDSQNRARADSMALNPSLGKQGQRDPRRSLPVSLVKPTSFRFTHTHTLSPLVVLVNFRGSLTV